MSLEASTDSLRGTRSFNTKGMASEASLPEADHFKVYRF